MELQDGKTEFDEMTYSCTNKSCLYNKNKRCIYNVAKIKIRASRGCYDELRQDEIECELDYLDSLRREVCDNYPTST